MNRLCKVAFAIVCLSGVLPASAQYSDPGTSPNLGPAVREVFYVHETSFSAEWGGASAARVFQSAAAQMTNGGASRFPFVYGGTTTVEPPLGQCAEGINLIRGANNCSPSGCGTTATYLPCGATWTITVWLGAYAYSRGIDNQNPSIQADLQAVMVHEFEHHSHLAGGTHDTYPHVDEEFTAMNATNGFRATFIGGMAQAWWPSLRQISREELELHHA